MSVQFGRWNFTGNRLTPEAQKEIDDTFRPYAPDTRGIFFSEGVTIIHRALHTTSAARSEVQPRVTAAGGVICWDGRLDNRSQIIRDLGDGGSPFETDLDVVAAAYAKWETKSFARLIGDWSFAAWEPKRGTVILAKDFLGTRPLYYCRDTNCVSWSSLLDPLIRFSSRPFSLSEEYIAGWLAHFPAAHLTPYLEISSVPPSCFVRLTRDKTVVAKYWDFDSNLSVCYRTDSEYEEHFRSVFFEAIRRRLRSESPILAELSGGVDSSSIVCVADTVIAAGEPPFPRLDTVSYFNDSEPNWNERPYFTLVEKKRGRTGCHIDLGSTEPSSFQVAADFFSPTPGSYRGRRTEPLLEFAACLALRGTRVVLSGVGGDEVAGGVPTPNPHLMDLLVTGQIARLASHLKVWALAKRKPWLHLFVEAARSFCPTYFSGIPATSRPADWINRRFADRHQSAITGYPRRTKVFGPLPSFQENVAALDVLRRQLASSPLPADPPYEKRYPYLDRDLLEFIFAIPRDQLVRPGERRSLVRRALAGIVPDELLSRKRKAYVVKSPLVSIAKQESRLVELSQNMLTADLGIIDRETFRQAVRGARSGREIRTVPLSRTLEVESWLQNIRNFNFVAWPSA
jgi:asparagine synthase (glutamine-hydrolysing)